jgi:hypothetical protein
LSDVANNHPNKHPSNNLQRCVSESNVQRLLVTEEVVGRQLAYDLVQDSCMTPSLKMEMKAREGHGAGERDEQAV